MEANEDDGLFDGIEKYLDAEVKLDADWHARNIGYLKKILSFVSFLSESVWNTDQGNHPVRNQLN